MRRRHVGLDVMCFVALFSVIWRALIKSGCCLWAVNTIVECIMIRHILVRFFWGARRGHHQSRCHGTSAHVCNGSPLVLIPRNALAIAVESAAALTLENGACESLLSMVCDGISWVDADGDTIVSQ